LTIRAEIEEFDICIAEGISVRGSAPVLAMCRKLVEAGYDPATPLHAYRGDTLCLTVTSIGWGAEHTVADNVCGTPVLRRYRPQATMVTAPPIRFSERAATRSK
jgi:hypothetical protein